MKALVNNLQRKGHHRTNGGTEHGGHNQSVIGPELLVIRHLIGHHRTAGVIGDKAGSHGNINAQ